MPLKNYCLLKGTVVDSQEAKSANPHYQIRVVDDTTTYRIAVNVRSKLSPPDLKYYIDADFQHPLLDAVADAAIGMHKLSDDPIKRRDSGLCLDYLRMNLFPFAQMKAIPSFAPGPDNDLNEKIDRYVDELMGDENNLIYAFGERWGPEPQRTDKYFGFLPGNGIHDIHFNQGSSGQFKQDNGVYQDGGLLFYFAAENRYVAYFTKFQSQANNTDEQTGHPIAGNHETTGTATGATGGFVVSAGGPRVRIVAALVNPVNGNGAEKETVTLLNTTAADIDLAGWKLLDKADVATPLSGKLAAGAASVVKVLQPMVLSNKGGTITLLDATGLKVHGVAYTKQQAGKEGETVVF